MNALATDLDRELDEMADRELRAPRTALAPPPATMDDKNLAVITHIATIAAAVFTAGVLDIIVPAVAYFVFRDHSRFLKDHVKHQLNFQLTNLLVAIAAVVFSVVTFGFGLVVALPAIALYFVMDIVCSIRAAMAASRGEDYEFPLTIDFIK